MSADLKTAWHRVNSREWEYRAEDGHPIARVRKLGRYWHGTMAGVRDQSEIGAKLATERAIKAAIDRVTGG